ncbi:MAG: hypothetical protein FJX75_14490 [Armatimonadetes bacterium]|nr:hypothetical protein [Armatimonadota bacterium]
MKLHLHGLFSGIVLTRPYQVWYNTLGSTTAGERFGVKAVGAAFPVGRARKTVDSKGRVQLPITQATALGNDVYVCRGHGTFLEIYALLAWQRYLAKLVAAAERGPRRYRALLRHVLGSAVAAKVDPQSRLVIPREILDWAKLSITSDDDSREVMVVGVGECVEVWNPDLYEEETDKARPSLGDIWDEARHEYVATGIAETDLDTPAEDDESE